MAGLQENLELFADTMGDKVKELRVHLNNNAPNLNGLVTTNKSNIVAAINELKVALNAVPVIDDVGNPDIAKLWSSSKIHGEIMAALNSILNGAPTALDTLDEIAEALANDGNFAATITAQIDKRVRWDIDTQNLNSVQKQYARTNIDAASATDVGNTDTDFVALFNQGLL